MTDITKTGPVSSAAAAGSEKIDRDIFNKTQEFIESLIIKLSRNHDLMDKVRDIRKIAYKPGETFEVFNTFDENVLNAKEIITADLTANLNSNEPGAKFLKKLFQIFNRRRPKFVSNILNVLTSGICEPLKSDELSRSVFALAKKLHSELIDVSPYIYTQACEEIRTGKKAADNLDEFRKVTGIKTAAKKPARVKTGFEISEGSIMDLFSILRDNACGMKSSKNLLDAYAIEKKIRRTKEMGITPEKIMTDKYRKAVKNLRAEIERVFIHYLRQRINCRVESFLLEIINTHPKAKEKLISKILLLTRSYVGKDGEFVLGSAAKINAKSLQFARDIISDFANKYPEVYQHVVLKVPAAEIEVPEAKQMPRSRSLRDVLNRPPAVVEKGKRFERVKTRVFRI